MISSDRFALPAMKDISSGQYKIVMIEFTETEIQRPKKATISLFW
nr:hypothetical protein [Lactococcus sp.]